MAWFGALASGWVIEKRGDRSSGGDEAAQVALLADGDRAAFEALYTRYGRPLLAYVDELLDVVGLRDAARRKLKSYSGGMKRRIGIAQALLNEPGLLIVDEPTAGLDPEERIHFRTLLAELAGARTVLLSTHIVEDIAQTSRMISVLDRGRVLFHGTTSHLITAARGHVFTVSTDGPRPEGELTVVSMIQHETATEYRVVGAEAPAGAVALEPGLEDSYVWLMRSSRGSRSTAA